MEGREDGERSARLRPWTTDVGDEVAGTGHGLDAGLSEHGAYSPVARECVGRRVARPVDGVGAHHRGERRQLPLRCAATHDEAAATLAQGVVELAQAVEQEHGARLRGEAASQQYGIEHEQRYDALVYGERRDERRVIVHAQIAPQPNDCGGRHRRRLRASAPIGCIVSRGWRRRSRRLGRE
jgi:hypothetical protein